jgi:hypothetical protein
MGVAAIQQLVGGCGDTVMRQSCGEDMISSRAAVWS